MGWEARSSESSAVAQAGGEEPGRGKAVGQEALLLMDVEGTAGEVVNQALRLQPVQSKEEWFQGFILERLVL